MRCGHLCATARPNWAAHRGARPGAAKSPTPAPGAVAANLPLAEKVLLFCLASGTEQVRVGITPTDRVIMMLRLPAVPAKVVDAGRIKTIGHR